MSLLDAWAWYAHFVANDLGYNVDIRNRCLFTEGGLMTITIDAVYAKGQFQPMHPVELAEGTLVQLTVQTAGRADDPFDAVIGTCEGPLDGAANHDKYLYGESQP